MKKIVSHLAPRHMDDWLAISLLSYLYPDAQREYVHPQKVPQEYLQDPQVAVVDVGSSYDTGKNNYDHHHDLNLECSLSLVVKKFFPELYPSEVLRAIDITDRFGVKKAVEEGLVSFDKEVDEKRKIILMTEPEAEAGRVAYKLLSYAKEVRLDHNSFISMLYESMKVLGLTQKAEEELRRQKEEFERKVSKVMWKDIEGFKVAISYESLAPYHADFFSQTQADILIEQNSMNKEHTSIIVNTNKAHKDKSIELADRLVDGQEIVFRHATGFIRVINRAVQEFVGVLNA
ncbi:MAG: MYG1 family protein [Sulfolobales archaeon]